MTGRQRDAILRLVLICAAWALGEALEYAVGVSLRLPVVPAIFAAAAFMATQVVSWPGGSDDETYWRGRRIDRDRWRR